MPKKEEEPRPQTKIVIFGYRGIVTSQHLRILTELAKDRSDFKVSALVGRNTEAAKEVADKFGVEKVYEKYQEALKKEKPETVIIGTPNATHAEMAVAALHAGAHVLVEKPMGISEEEVRELVLAAKDNERLLIAGMSTRYYPSLAKLKELVEGNELGKVKKIKAVYKRRSHIPPNINFTKKELSGGGALMDLGIHVLDASLWILGYPEEEQVLAVTEKGIVDRDVENKWGPIPEEFDVEDMAFLSLKTKEGQLVTVEAAWAIESAEASTKEFPDEEAPYLVVNGTKAEAIWRPGRLEIYKDGREEPEVIKIGGDRFKIQMENFLNAVKEGKKEPPIPYEEMITLHRILDKAYKSAS